MEAIETFLRSFRGTHGVQIFLVALIVVFIKVALKYATKIDIFKDSAQPTRDQKRAAHFECLRVGMDLALLGIVCFVSTLRATLSVAIPDVAQMNALGNLQPSVLLFQILLLVLATIFTGIFDTVEKSYRRGILVPGILGCVSITISVGVFFFISRGK
jgi:hypothetical protein